VKGPRGRSRIAWCSWHNGLADTARAVRSQTEAASGPNGGLLYACARCRQQHDLTPLTERNPS
jgi:hypothetical protein